MSKKEKRRKNPHAVALGKLGGGRPKGPQPWKALGISRQAWYSRERRKRLAIEKGGKA